MNAPGLIGLRPFALYNEIDPHAAEWMRELIKMNLIADGEVNEHSITDLDPSDLAGFTQCHFFAGIAVWSYSLRRAGWEDDRPVWTGSCPCQPFSTAGSGDGLEDERHLWPAWYELIKACRPDQIFGEQVSSAAAIGKVGRKADQPILEPDQWAWLDHVQIDLEDSHYAVGHIAATASECGSPHIRQRLYFTAIKLADPASAGLEGTAGPSLQEHGSGPASVGASGGLGDRSVTGLGGYGRYVGQGYGSGRNGADQSGPASTSGTSTGGLADNHHDQSGQGRVARGQESTGGEHGTGLVLRSGPGGVADHGSRGSEVAVQHTRGSGQASGVGTPNGTGSHSLAAGTSPTNGSWANASWLWCRDAKWRAIESSLITLANGTSDRMGHSGGQSDTNHNGPAKKEEVDETMQSVLSGVGPETPGQRSVGTPNPLRKQEILRHSLHGGGSHESTVHQSTTQPSQSASSGMPPGLRDLSGDGETGSSSQGRRPAEQFPIEPDYFVSKLPSSIALAEFRSDDQTKEALLGVWKAIQMEGSVQRPLSEAAAVWASLTDESKARITRQHIDHSHWAEHHVSPLADSRSAESEARKVRLKGYGNAIVSDQAVHWIRASMNL